MKVNCWEFKRCERQPGGINVLQFGVCPATTEKRLHGVHCGINAGRACWVMAGTMCGGAVKGTFAQNNGNCLMCDFYNMVKKEEGPRHKFPIVLLNRVRAFEKSDPPL